VNLIFAVFRDIDEGVKRLCQAMKELIDTKDNQEVFMILKSIP